ncbi:hypothetical protein AB0F20_35655 [Streptomyces goshikiensis]|uniref:hypothetical protein n=1 Tax=Streptomyces goshikiensis TaxID=1942 RepID=UPI00199A22C0|nr:hypothetical protein GCM10010336_51500 [Streptomyces goshikiensis]
MLDGPAQHRRPPRLRRGLALRQEDLLDPVRVGMPALAEAEREGWLGEIEGLKVSLAGAEDKLAQIDRQSQKATISLGMPTTRSGDLE